MRYNLILWDFDGTLANTLGVALEIYNKLAASKHYRVVEDPYAVRDMGMRQFLSTHGVPIYRVPVLFSAFLKELKKRSGSVTLNPGIRQCVQSISDMGIRQGIVSSNNTENIQCCLSRHELESCFSYVSGTSRIFGKEKRIRAAVEQLSVPQHRVLYVGDEIRDIEAALAAGVDIASVGWGLNSKQALNRHSPNYFAGQPSELLEVIRGGFVANPA